METDMDYAEAEAGATRRTNYELKLEEQWHAKYQELINYREEHGNCLVSQTSKTYPSLAEWIHSQRKNYMKGILSQERIVLLDAIDFVWHPNNYRWEKMFRQLQEFKAEKGHCNVPSKYKENKPLAKWVERERKKYNDKTLPEEHLRLLDEIGFTPNPCMDKWNEKYNELVKFQLENGHANVPREHPSLGNWIASQRRTYAENNLVGAKITLLQKVGFLFSPRLETNNATAEKKAITEARKEDRKEASQIVTGEAGMSDVHQLLANCHEQLKQSQLEVKRLMAEIKSKDEKIVTLGEKIVAKNEEIFRQVNEIRRLRLTISALVD